MIEQTGRDEFTEPAGWMESRARALYLGSTLYRIDGSNEPETIGQAVSSGCIRMLNEDVIDVCDRAKVGTCVVVTGGNAGLFR